MAETPSQQALLRQVEHTLSRSPRHIYSPTHIFQLFDQLRSEWTLPKGITRDKFQELLIATKILSEIKLSATRDFSWKRYNWGPFSGYELAQSLRPGSYLSHATAAFLHGLAAQEPTILYVNKEQSPKSHSGSLSQEALNRAFANEQRESDYLVMHDRIKIMLLSGKNSRRLGVENLAGPQGETLEVTSLERTLIDMAVRPAYAGGTHSLASTYARAKGRISVKRLARMLADLDHLYPYHQAIGFLLQRAGYEAHTLAALRRPGLRYDFFLAHGMTKPRYDQKWRMYYPHDLKTPGE